MAYELLLSARPGQTLSAEAEAALVAAVRADPALAACEVAVHGDDRSEDPVLSVVLQEAFEDDELTREDFDAFCEAERLPADPDNPVSASAFLAARWPTPVVGVGLPEDDAGASRAFAALVRLARVHQVLLEDPQARRPLELDRVSELPPLWS